MSWTMRRARKLSMPRTRRNADSKLDRGWTVAAPFPPPRGARGRSERGARRKSRSLQLQPDHAHQPVRHRPVALEPGRMRDQISAVIEVDDRFVLEDRFRH